MIEGPVVIQKPVKRKKVKIILWCLFALVFLAAAVCTSISIHVGWSLSHPEKVPLEEKPEDYSMPYELVTFMSRDEQVRLSGWYFPSADDSLDMETTLIFAHGYRQNRLNGTLETLQLAKDLTYEGFSILMFDFRNSGESEGSVSSIGYFEKQDLLGAVDLAVELNPDHRIGVIGFSMGAATALITAADDTRIEAVISDSTFHDLRAYLKENLSVWSDLPYFPFTPLILSIIPPLTGIDVDQVSPLKAVDRIYPRPVLFIHSTLDDRIPHVSSKVLYDKHKDRFQYWETNNKGHAKTYNELPKQYVERIVDFFEGRAD